jgi:predicted DNA-binding transcriptional regulator YafY
MQQLLSNLQPGLLEPHVAPLLSRLRSLLDVGEHSPESVEQRIRVIHLASRSRELPHFPLVASALLKRLRLKIRYRGRERDETTEREISPQRLVHYRDNWYLDAWCHLREALRSFAMDAIQEAQVLERRARAIPERELDEVLAAGYGIFSGRAVTWARLRFSAERARWVSAESWHPQQRGRFLDDGRYELELPYSDPRELLMDIQRHGPHVEVLDPPAMREALRGQLRATLAQYAARGRLRR